MTNDYFIYVMPESRPADYCLGCAGGSVFIDFNRMKSGRLKLIRISFDGHGCYEVNEEVTEMGNADSQLFIDMVKTKAIKQDEMKRMLKEYFSENSRLMQYDAMVEYGLHEA